MITKTTLKFLLLFWPLPEKRGWVGGEGGEEYNVRRLQILGSRAGLHDNIPAELLPRWQI